MLNNVKLFIAECWKRVTANMRPWLKYSLGPVLTALVVLATPIWLTGAVVAFLIAYALEKLKRSPLWEKITGFFFVKDAQGQ